MIDMSLTTLTAIGAEAEVAVIFTALATLGGSSKAITQGAVV